VQPNSVLNIYEYVGREPDIMINDLSKMINSQMIE